MRQLRGTKRFARTGGWRGGRGSPYNLRMHDWSFDFLRRQIVGIDSAFDTPFGRRLMVYCDYTASGRCLIFVERYLQTLQRSYANTHTEDDVTGRSMSRLLHEAEAMIKRAVNAGPRRPHRRLRHGRHGRDRQAAADPRRGPAARDAPRARRRAAGSSSGTAQFEAFRAFQQSHQPVVFVGPYEHHSNEVTWRQGLATVVEVNLAPDGGVDLAHLETLLQEPEYQGRLRIGSFSAASNVTGMRSPVREIARLLHAPRRLRLLRLRGERALRRDRHEPAARSGRRRRLDRRGVPLAAQVPRRPGLERRAGVQRAALLARPAAERGGRRHGGLREPRSTRTSSPTSRSARRPARPACCRPSRPRWRSSSSAASAPERIEAREARAARAGACARWNAAPAHRDPRQPRPGAAHRHRVVQPRRSARPLPAPEVRHRAAQRPVRHPVARRAAPARGRTATACSASTRRPRSCIATGCARASRASSPAGAASGSTTRWTMPRPGSSWTRWSSSPSTGIASCACMRSMPCTGAWSHREYRETHAAFSLEAALQAGGCDETALAGGDAREAVCREPRRGARRGPSGSASLSARARTKARRASGNCGSSTWGEPGREAVLTDYPVLKPTGFIDSLDGVQSSPDAHHA